MAPGLPVPVSPRRRTGTSRSATWRISRAAELFGSRKGAFTGAERPRSGYFQQARGGTLFLDEIGEAPPEVQVMLLRVLETGEVRPLGAERSERLDVRVIAATDADLEAQVANGSFRAPLLHRLNGYSVHVPPLRRRREDFGRLFHHFLAEELDAVGETGRLADPGDAEPWLPAELTSRLAAHPWPGNVRELRNVARQLVIASRGAPRLWLNPEIERLLADAAASSAPETPDTPPPDTPPPATAPAREYRDPATVGAEELEVALVRTGCRRRGCGGCGAAPSRSTAPWSWDARSPTPSPKRTTAGSSIATSRPRT